MKIDFEMPKQAIWTNFWERKMMAGSIMFYNAEIAELQSPELAFFAFCMFFLCFQPNSWIKTEGIDLKPIFLFLVLTFSTKEKLMNECWRQF